MVQCCGRSGGGRLLDCSSLATRSVFSSPMLSFRAGPNGWLGNGVIVRAHRGTEQIVHEMHESGGVPHDRALMNSIEALMTQKRSFGSVTISKRQEKLPAGDIAIPRRRHDEETT